jgi:phosphoribosylformylglycinamidine synthase
MRFAVIVFPGSNCDHDAYYAAKEVLGQQAEFVWHKETDLRGADAVILPGGFSLGDYLRTGAIARFSPVMEPSERSRRWSRARHLQRLPDFARNRLLPGAMLRNRDGSCAGTCMCRSNRPTRRSRSPAASTGAPMPIAHGEGNYFTTPEGLRRLEQNRQIVFRYVDAAGVATDESIQTVAQSIAGICSEGGTSSD